MAVGDAVDHVRSVDDVNTIFGPENTPERRTIIRAMDLGNKLDYLYMLLYSGFLALFSFTCARITNRKLFYFPLFLAGLALAGDALENIQLLGITANMETMNIGVYLDRLHPMTWIKWGSLALIFLFLSPYFFTGGLFSKIIASVGIACFLLAAGAFIHRSVLNEVFGGMTAVMFVLMIIYSFIYKTPDG